MIQLRGTEVKRGYGLERLRVDDVDPTTAGTMPTITGRAD
jgi:hypothetical protein